MTDYVAFDASTKFRGTQPMAIRLSHNGGQGCFVVGAHSAQDLIEPDKLFSKHNAIILRFDDVPVFLARKGGFTQAHVADALKRWYDSVVVDGKTLGGNPDAYSPLGDHVFIESVESLTDQCYKTHLFNSPMPDPEGGWQSPEVFRIWCGS
jgi:hypothetical protein